MVVEDGLATHWHLQGWETQGLVCIDHKAMASVPPSFTYPKGSSKWRIVATIERMRDCEQDDLHALHDTRIPPRRDSVYLRVENKLGQARMGHYNEVGHVDMHVGEAMAGTSQGRRGTRDDPKPACQDTAHPAHPKPHQAR
jgi:hypothetical protein